MASEQPQTQSLHSPTAIPPRTSSNGVVNSNPNRNSGLGAISEGEWMSSSKKKHLSTTSKHGRNRSSVDWTVAKDILWSQEKDRILMGPFDYLTQQPGKDIRKQMITAFDAWLKVPESSLAIITKVVTMLHTASLLIDDVEDSSTLRRGSPVAHNIFGTAQTINSANYVYFLALQELQKLKNPTAIDIYTEELLNLHRGQGMDLFWRDTLTCPTEEEYLEMVDNKTGGLFRLAVKLMQAESDTNKDCVPLVNILGLIFQICDDYLNLSDTTYSKNKGLCEDLTEGKFSFPIIHSIRSDPSNVQLINILKQKTKDDEVKLYALKYMESTSSFAYTRKVVGQLRDKAYPMIDAMDGVQDDPNGNREGQLVRDILEKIIELTLKDRGKGK
ncbi:geranylgeranyl diphosphate synthase [Talaromyces proteolyticus]|uniref:Geranylgeranyl diphosphate synthase n=1 Tax=Talaromyces proteolyticus TaxID=1131652 RepID=A0AAD4KXU4_9EURO|nr:geranylgeranyl diphosphate synthase [Talaromyces proteolyticus]KAH8698481.1 geranylgeranyl diphosphate synthase [Talaromyces proteolyticus]